MKFKFTCLAAMVIAVAVISCKKDSYQRSKSDEISLNSYERNANEVQFAKTLAKAIKEVPGLRTFIKTEALKQFDKDDDVLFQMVKDAKVDGKSTFYEILVKYADDKEKFDQACNKLPLLTILVPTTPSFSPENWKPEAEIPVIAVEPDSKINSGKVSLYDEAGKREDLSPALIPAYPVLVVKINDRVILNTTGTSNSRVDHNLVQEKTSTFFSNEKFSFKFWDNAFDNLTTNNSSSRIGINRPQNDFYTIDKVNVDAYNSGSEWHRDYVYYGIAPGTPNGAFTNRFSEFITSFQFVNGDGLKIISDQDNDPKTIPVLIDPNGQAQWTEGLFEFRISIFINAKNGVGQELRKAFTAKGSDLFDLQYGRSGFTWRLTTVTPKPYNPNIEIVPWDLEQYGSAWKFVVMEYDPTEEFTRTVTHTSTYGANFEIDASTGTKVKIGGKFGASATFQSSTVYQYKTTTGSDDLAEGVLDFRTPVITALSTINSPFLGQRQLYQTYEVSTGMVTMAVEPKRIY